MDVYYLIKVGLAGSAANTGMPVSMFEWAAPFWLYLLGYWVTPIYLNSNVVTTPEWIEMRYNRIIRLYNAGIMLFIFIFTVISATLYAGSIILEVIMGWNMWVSSIILICGTGLYVILGGLRAVIYTENIQSIILIIGGLIVSIYSFNAVGGIKGLREYYKDTNQMNMARKIDDKDWPWLGLYVSIILGGYYYWNCNQMLVQRVLCSKSNLHAKYGCIFASTLKILPVFMMVIPGMISVILYKNEFINDNATDYDLAYPTLVINLLPKGLIGIVIASMLSALMSSLASVYNSASTIITNDIYKIIYPDVNDKKLVKIGRISSLIFIIISVLWLPIIKNGNSELFIYIQQIYAYIQNPLCVLFFFGHFWSKTNIYGAYCCIIIGTSLGLVRFIFTITLNNKHCQNIFCQSHYLYFGLFIIILCTFIIITVSLLTQHLTSNKTESQNIPHQKGSQISPKNASQNEMIKINNESTTNLDTNSINSGEIFDTNADDFSVNAHLVGPSLPKSDIDNIGSSVSFAYTNKIIPKNKSQNNNKSCCYNIIYLDGINPKNWKYIANVWYTLIAICVVVLLIIFR